MSHSLLHGRAGKCSYLAALVLPCLVTFVSIGLSSETDRLATLDDELNAFIERHTVRNLVPIVENKALPKGPMFELGKELFFSKSLSGDLDVACASCHHPHLAGGDKLSLPVGESPYQPNLLGPGRWHDWKTSKDPKSRGGPNVPRNSQTIFNSALYNKAMFYDGRVFRLDNESTTNNNQGTPAFRTPESNLWQADPNAGKSLLAAQARLPVVSAHEMLGYGFGEGSDHNAVREFLVNRIKGTDSAQAGKNWLALFQKAFNKPHGSADDLITFGNIQEAIAFYERTQILIDNDWYAYVLGDKARLTQKEKQGALLFFKDVLDGGAGCARCHTPPNFTDEAFHNIAVPQFGRGIQADHSDFGRRGVSQREEDRYGFRTPSLLNVARTFPYGHTGAFQNLSSVIKHHLSPKASLEHFDFTFSNNEQLRHVASLYANAKTLSFAALSALTKNQDSGRSLLPANLSLSDDQISSLEAFLNTLTDPCLDQATCLDKWLPNPKTPSPDGQRLKPVFAASDANTAPPHPIAKPTTDGLHDKLATTNKTSTDRDVLQKTARATIEPPAYKKPTRQNDKGNAEVKSAIASNTSLRSRFGKTMPEMPTTYTRRKNCRNANVALNEGTTIFEDIALAAGLTAKHKVSWDLYTLKTAQRVLFTGGVSVGEINGDCWPDIFHPTGDKKPDVLYKNNGDGTFQNISRKKGITRKEMSNGASMADIDGDGDTDILTTNILHPSLPSLSSAAREQKTGQSPSVYLNQDGKKLSVVTDTNINAFLTSWSVAFADYDADGDLDGLTTHWRGPGLGGEKTNHLWRNISAGHQLRYSAADKEARLTNITGKSDFTFTGTFSDFNNDGYPDILMVADFEETQIYLNNGDGTFNNVTSDSQINDKNGMGSAVGDYDNDGDLDWFVSSVWDPNGVAEGTWGTNGNRLYRNDNGVFTDVTDKAGVAEGFWGWGSCFADFNNDQHPDIFQVNGFDLRPPMARHLGGPGVYMKLKRSMREFESTPSKLFISKGDGTFQDKADEWGIRDVKSGRSVVCFDYDRDGDVDILVSNHQDHLLLYKNNTRAKPKSNFLNIALEGLGKNTRAVGAKIYVRANGVTQMREIRAGGQFLSSGPEEAHFGLGATKTIDEVAVIWPRPHYGVSFLHDVPINEFISIQHPKSTPPSSVEFGTDHRRIHNDG